MIVMFIGEHCDRTPFDNIQAPTIQRETNLREIVDRETKPQFGVEPPFDEALIVRNYAGQFAWL